MRINPSIANQMYMNYADSSDTTDSTGTSATSLLPTGTYSKLAASKYIKDNDKDHDGKLSSDEVSISAEAFAKLDADSDGKLSKTEMQDALAGKDAEIYQYYKTGGDKTHANGLASSVLGASNAGSTGSYSALAANRFLNDKDANGDGVLSASEASLSTKVFAKLDKNSDGMLSSTELKTALAGKNSTIQKYYKNGGTKTLTDLTSSLLKTI